MFDIGFGEMIVLGVIALIAIGPKQLPEVARTVGRLLNELKRASSDMTRTFAETRDSFTSQINDVQNSMPTFDHHQSQLDANNLHHGHHDPHHGHHDPHHAHQHEAGDEHNQMSFDLASQRTETSVVAPAHHENSMAVHASQTADTAHESTNTETSVITTVGTDSTKKES